MARSFKRDPRGRFSGGGASTSGGGGGKRRKKKGGKSPSKAVVGMKSSRA